MNTKRRIGFLGIILEDREQSHQAVNDVLSAHHANILARMGLPRQGGTAAVITLVIEASTDELGALSGKLGAIPGISIKSGLAPHETN